MWGRLPRLRVIFNKERHQEMPSTDLNQCVPELAGKATLLIEKCKEQGIIIAITCTSRTLSEQIALYAQGRKSLLVVNDLRHDAELPHIREQDNHIVTWTLDSKHVINSKRPQAEAFDIVLMKNGKPDWLDIKTYKKIAEIGKSIGLKSGADFKKKDYPHFEI